MLRLGFTTADMGRVRVAPAAGPLAEIVLALGCAAGRTLPSLGAEWRDTARRRASRVDLETAALLHPRENVVLDLFTLTGLPNTIGETEHALLGVDKENFATEYAAVQPTRTSDWLPGLRDADRNALRALARALIDAYRRLVAPYWPVVSAYADAHREGLIRSLGERGPEETLARVSNGSWDDSVLCFPHAALWSKHTVAGSLSGRGMVLVPSIFVANPVPYFPLDPSLPAILLSPAKTGRRVGAAGRSMANGTERMLGRTRTALLRTIANEDLGCSTTEAAAAINVSPGTASEQLAVLRDGGLVLAVRRGRRMLHTATPLGRRLLDASITWPHETGPGL